MLNVLLIDENPVEYRLINQMLKDCHKGPYVIRHADTYEKAITIRKTQKTDIILVDSKLLEAGAPGAGAAALVSISTETKSPEVLTSININVDYLKDKILLEVYDIVDKYQLRRKLFEPQLGST